MTTTISRLYNSQMEARMAVRDLEAAGLKNGDISIMASNADNWYDAKTKTYHDLDSKDDRAEGAATGGGIGAAAGGAAGLLAGLGLIAIPGVGPVVGTVTLSLVHLKRRHVLFAGEQTVGRREPRRKIKGSGHIPGSCLLRS
jgi:hypothetical protein